MVPLDENDHRVTQMRKEAFMESGNLSKTIVPRDDDSDVSVQPDNLEKGPNISVKKAVEVKII